jgi:hypothetical protein
MKKILILFLGLVLFKGSISDDLKKPLRPAEFEGDFVWLNAGKCNKPPVPPLKPIYFRDPKNEKDKKRIFVRRWLDADGDGICEVYDIGEMEISNFTSKIYGYPIRISKYVGGRWKASPTTTGSWVPLILMDKSNGQRMQVDYVYGNAGYSTAAGFIPEDCELVRKYLAISYMLLFHFPEFAKNDPITDPKGYWNDVISGWLSATYTDPLKLRQLKLPMECKDKYRLVVSALVDELSR